MQDQLEIWSAAPTPLTRDMSVDVESVRRLVDHHVILGVKGMFIAGTCGEGPMLLPKDIRILTQTAAQAAKGRIAISVQVTDNSPVRILENINNARQDGADIAILAEPWFEYGDDDKEYYYNTVLDRATLPVAIYTRKRIFSVAVYQKFAQHKNVKMVKDSTNNGEMMAVFAEAKRARPELVVMTGFEFAVDKYLKAGYDGVLSGGCALTAPLLRSMILAAKNKDFNAAERIQRQCTEILTCVYGGEKYPNWLVGLKYSLMQLGIFETPATHVSYKLPESLKQDIQNALRPDGLLGSILIPAIQKGKTER